MRIYHRSDVVAPESLEGWKQIYFMTDTEVYDATEVDEDIRLSEYLQQHDSTLYYLSPDEKVVHAVDNATAKILFSYVLEDSWSPSSEG